MSKINLMPLAKAAAFTTLTTGFSTATAFAISAGRTYIPLAATHLASASTLFIGGFLTATCLTAKLADLGLKKIGLKNAPARFVTSHVFSGLTTFGISKTLLAVGVLAAIPTPMGFVALTVTAAAISLLVAGFFKATEQLKQNKHNNNIPQNPPTNSNKNNDSQNNTTFVKGTTIHEQLAKEAAEKHRNLQRRKSYTS